MGPLRTGAVRGGRRVPGQRRGLAKMEPERVVLPVSCRSARRARAVREGTAIWKPGRSLIRRIDSNVLAGEKLSGTRNGARGWAWGKASRR